MKSLPVKSDLSCFLSRFLVVIEKTFNDCQQFRNIKCKDDILRIIKGLSGGTVLACIKSFKRPISEKAADRGMGH